MRAFRSCTIELTRLCYSLLHLDVTHVARPMVLQFVWVVSINVTKDTALVLSDMTGKILFLANFNWFYFPRLSMTYNSSLVCRFFCDCGAGSTGIKCKLTGELSRPAVSCISSRHAHTCGAEGAEDQHNDIESPLSWWYSNLGNS